MTGQLFLMVDILEFFPTLYTKCWFFPTLYTTITQKKVNAWNALIKIAIGNCGKIAP